MKKHKSHARHVFAYLETQHGIKVAFNEDDSTSKKGDRSSLGTGGKLSNISKNSDFSDSTAAIAGAKSNGRVSNTTAEKGGAQSRKSRPSPQVKKKNSVVEDYMQAQQATNGGFTFTPLPYQNQTHFE